MKAHTNGPSLREKLKSTDLTQRQNEKMLSFKGMFKGVSPLKCNSCDSRVSVLTRRFCCGGCDKYFCAKCSTNNKSMFGPVMGAHMCFKCVDVAQASQPPISPVAPRPPSKLALATSLPNSDEEDTFVTIEIDSSPASSRDKTAIQSKGAIRPPRKSFNRSNDITTQCIIRTVNNLKEKSKNKSNNLNHQFQDLENHTPQKSNLKQIRSPLQTLHSNTISNYQASSQISSNKSDKIKNNIDLVSLSTKIQQKRFENAPATSTTTTTTTTTPNNTKYTTTSITKNKKGLSSKDKFEGFANVFSPRCCYSDSESSKSPVIVYIENPMRLMLSNYNDSNNDNYNDSNDNDSSSNDSNRTSLVMVSTDDSPYEKVTAPSVSSSHTSSSPTSSPSAVLVQTTPSKTKSEYPLALPLPSISPSTLLTPVHSHDKIIPTSLSIPMPVTMTPTPMKPTRSSSVHNDTGSRSNNSKKNTTTTTATTPNTPVSVSASTMSSPLASTSPVTTATMTTKEVVVTPASHHSNSIVKSVEKRKSTSDSSSSTTTSSSKKSRSRSMPALRNGSDSGSGIPGLVGSSGGEKRSSPSDGSYSSPSPSPSVVRGYNNRVVHVNNTATATADDTSSDRVVARTPTSSTSSSSVDKRLKNDTPNAVRDRSGGSSSRSMLKYVGRCSASSATGTSPLPPVHIQTMGSGTRTSDDKIGNGSSASSGSRMMSVSSSSSKTSSSRSYRENVNCPTYIPIPTSSVFVSVSGLVVTAAPVSPLTPYSNRTSPTAASTLSYKEDVDVDFDYERGFSDISSSYDFVNNSNNNTTLTEDGEDERGFEYCNDSYEVVYDADVEKDYSLSAFYPDTPSPVAVRYSKAHTAQSPHSPRIHMITDNSTRMKLSATPFAVRTKVIIDDYTNEQVPEDDNDQHHVEHQHQLLASSSSLLSADKLPSVSVLSTYIVDMLQNTETQTQPQTDECVKELRSARVVLWRYTSAVHGSIINVLLKRSFYLIIGGCVLIIYLATTTTTTTIDNCNSMVVTSGSTDDNVRSFSSSPLITRDLIKTINYDEMQASLFDDMNTSHLNTIELELGDLNNELDWVSNSDDELLMGWNDVKGDVNMKLHMEIDVDHMGLVSACALEEKCTSESTLHNEVILNMDNNSSDRFESVIPSPYYNNYNYNYTSRNLSVAALSSLALMMTHSNFNKNKNNVSDNEESLFRISDSVLYGDEEELLYNAFVHHVNRVFTFVVNGILTLKQGEIVLNEMEERLYEACSKTARNVFDRIKTSFLRHTRKLFVTQPTWEERCICIPNKPYGI